MKEESIFHSRIKLLSKTFGKSLNRIEKELGYPRNALNNYKNNVEPSAKRVLELSDYFKVSPQYLLGIDQEMVSEVNETSLNLFFEKLTFTQKLKLASLSQHWFADEVKDSQSDLS